MVYASVGAITPVPVCVSTYIFSGSCAGVCVCVSPYVSANAYCKLQDLTLRAEFLRPMLYSDRSFKT